MVVLWQDHAADDARTSHRTAQCSGGSRLDDVAGLGDLLYIRNNSRFNEKTATLPRFLFKTYITIAIRLRYDYDEKLPCSFFDRVESRQMEAGARDTS